MGSQVFTVLVCMAVIISKADVNWGDAFDGFVPSKVLVSSQGLYNCKPSNRTYCRFLDTFFDSRRYPRCYGHAS